MHKVLSGDVLERKTEQGKGEGDERECYSVQRDTGYSEEVTLKVGREESEEGSRVGIRGQKATEREDPGREGRVTRCTAP